MTEPAIVLGAEPVRQGRGARRQGHPRHRAARDRRPQRHVAAARRLRGRAPRGRQRARRRDRHAEEHDLRVRARRHRVARGVPAAARRPLHELVRLGERRPVGGRAVRVAPHPRARRRRTTTRSCASGQEVRTAVVVADGAERHVIAGLTEPHGAEDDRVGVRGLPEGPVHDPARDRATASWRRMSRRAGATAAATRGRLQRRLRERARAAARGVRRAVLGRAAGDALRHGQSRARAAPRDRRDPLLDAEQAPLRGRPRARSGSTTRTRCSSRPTGPTASSRRRSRARASRARPPPGTASPASADRVRRGIRCRSCGRGRIDAATAAR